MPRQQKHKSVANRQLRKTQNCGSRPDVLTPIYNVRRSSDSTEFTVDTRDHGVAFALLVAGFSLVGIQCLRRRRMESHVYRLMGNQQDFDFWLSHLREEGGNSATVQSESAIAADLGSALAEARSSRTGLMLRSDTRREIDDLQRHVKWELERGIRSGTLDLHLTCTTDRDRCRVIIWAGDPQVAYRIPPSEVLLVPDLKADAKGRLKSNTDVKR